MKKYFSQINKIFFEMGFGILGCRENREKENRKNTKKH